MLSQDTPLSVLTPGSPLILCDSQESATDDLKMTGAREEIGLEHRRQEKLEFCLTRGEKAAFE